jgi:hypothetical protein
LSARLVKARFYIYFDPDDFEVHVYDLGGNDLIQPFTVTSPPTGWFDVPLNVEVSGDFFIAIEYIVDYSPDMGIDTDSKQGPSYYRMSSTDPWTPDSVNFMIRAEVCEIQPVGGELLPNTVSTTGTLIISGIWTAVFSIGFALKKRKFS